MIYKIFSLNVRVGVSFTTNNCIFCLYLFLYILFGFIIHILCKWRMIALQTVVFCLVDIYIMLGKAFLPYLQGLNSTQLKLVTIYANRISQARTGKTIDAVQDQQVHWEGNNLWIMGVVKSLLRILYICVHEFRCGFYRLSFSLVFFKYIGFLVFPFSLPRLEFGECWC